MELSMVNPSDFKEVTSNLSALLLSLILVYFWP